MISKLYTSQNSELITSKETNTTRKMSICDELFVMKITIYNENRLIFIENNYQQKKKKKSFLQ